MQLRTIALTSANEHALTAVSNILLDAAAEHGVQLVVLQGVRTAAEAWALRDMGGELWRIGEDASTPELDTHVDRAIDDSAPERMEREIRTAFKRYADKRAIAVVPA